MLHKNLVMEENMCTAILQTYTAMILGIQAQLLNAYS
jgi:hypothetical protein